MAEYDTHRTWKDNYPVMEGDGAFVEEFNRRMGQYWVDTGLDHDVNTLVLDILMDAYVPPKGQERDS